MAEVLEHQPVAGAQPAVPRARAPQVLAPGDHGRSHLLRPEGGTLPLPGCEEIRHTVPNICALREPSTQYARTKR